MMKDISKVLKIISDIMGTQVTEDALRDEDFLLDSLALLQIIGELEEINVNITIEDVFQVRSVRNLIKVLEE